MNQPESINSNSSETIMAYDAIADTYSIYSESRKAYLSQIEKLVIQNLKPNTRLLDVGAGDGRRLKKISDTVLLAEVVAVEPSLRMAKLCEARLSKIVFNTLAENLDTLELGKFDYVTVLWNVFGHIPKEGRLKTLINFREKLNESGVVILDVNNRHNSKSYGFWKVFFRRIIDALDFKSSRGDASYSWKIGDQVLKSSGHLFTPHEMEKLISSAGLEIKTRLSVNYSSGQISNSPFQGQLFFILSVVTKK